MGVRGLKHFLRNKAGLRTNSFEDPTPGAPEPTAAASGGVVGGEEEGTEADEVVEPVDPADYKALLKKLAAKAVESIPRGSIIYIDGWSLSYQGPSMQEEGKDKDKQHV